jgi:uncharacterized protein YcfJ
MASLRSANLVDETKVSEASINFETIFGGKFRIIQTRASQGFSAAGAKISGALSSAGDKAISAAVTGRRLVNDREAIAKGMRAGAKIGGAVGAATGAAKGALRGARAGKAASDAAQSVKAKGNSIANKFGMGTKPDNSMKGKAKAAIDNVKQDAKTAFKGAKLGAQAGAKIGRATGTVSGAAKGAQLGARAAVGARQVKTEARILKSKVSSAIKPKKVTA